MLNVYAVSWCPHCQKTIEFLKQNQIEFNYFDMDTQPDYVVNKIIAVNGGKDWVVPTIEFNGTWRQGKVFNAEELREDLLNLGVMTLKIP